MPNLTFTAIDVETANRTRASICQIGIAQVYAGRITRTMSILVNPEEPFEYFQTGIHGIDANTVKDAETIPSIYPRIRRIIEQTTLVSHTNFDQQAIEKATTKYGLRLPQVRWLDSARIARRAWPQKYPKGSPSLKKVMADLGIAFNHHNAEDDARAAAEILLHTHHHTGMDVDDWLEEANGRTGAAARTPQERTPQKSLKEGPAGTPNRPTPQPQWATLLTKILTMEQKRAFDNSSVIRGLDSFLKNQTQHITEELGPSGPHRVLLKIQYEDLSPEERAWWTKQWLEVMKPDTSTDTHPHSSHQTSPQAQGTRGTQLRPPGPAPAEPSQAQGRNHTKQAQA